MAEVGARSTTLVGFAAAPVRIRSGTAVAVDGIGALAVVAAASMRPRFALPCQHGSTRGYVVDAVSGKGVLAQEVAGLAIANTLTFLEGSLHDAEHPATDLEGPQ